MDAQRKRLVGFALLAVGVAAGASFLGRMPREQTVHYVLGEGAPRVQELDVRWADARGASADDWAREATFRYAQGQAPRVVTHEPRLVDGDYTVEIDIATGAERRTVRRAVTLSGGATSIALAEAVPR